jgi:diadenosine tetraphosphatase ApaH/serine/threonine PP2A family protein phosphatase
MRLALLSDIHGNMPALRACLAHAQGAGAERIAVLGDLVGYGAEPGPVVDWARAVVAAGGIAVQGNHDAAVAGAQASPAGPGAKSAEAASVAWTHAQLDVQQRRFLAELPFTVECEGVLLVHASPHDPGRWHYIDRPERALQALQAARERHGLQRVLAGHQHEQRLYYSGRGRSLMPFDPTPGIPVPLAARGGWVATVGSVGQPRDGDPRAMFAVFDTRGQRLEFHRVAYDHAAAAAAIRRAALPPSFADRLERGR